MYEEMNKKLDSLYQGMQSFKRTNAIITDLKSQLNELNNKETKYLVELDMELEDIERLNRKSFSSLIYTILGTKEDKENKERQEAVAAQVKLDEVKRQKEEIIHKINDLQEEKNKLIYCESEYKKLYQEKYDLLKNSNSAQAQEIARLEHELSITKNKIKELDEAIYSGSLVLNRINDAHSSLNSAKNWGTWDLLGGGLISDLAKHSHIDDAKDAVSDIQVLLNNFRAELADVKIDSSISINIEGFAKFADFFFDGIIADWVVQSRINDSLDSVIQVESQVDNIISNLKQIKAGEESALNSLKEQLKAYVSEI